MGNSCTRPRPEGRPAPPRGTPKPEDAAEADASGPSLRGTGLARDFLAGLGLDLVYARAFELAGYDAEGLLRHLNEWDLDAIQRRTHVPILPVHRRLILEAAKEYEGLAQTLHCQDREQRSTTPASARRGTGAAGCQQHPRRRSSPAVAAADEEGDEGAASTLLPDSHQSSERAGLGSDPAGRAGPSPRRQHGLASGRCVDARMAQPPGHAASSSGWGTPLPSQVPRVAGGPSAAPAQQHTAPVAPPLPPPPPPPPPQPYRARRSAVHVAAAAAVGLFRRLHSGMMFGRRRKTGYNRLGPSLEDGGRRRLLKRPWQAEGDVPATLPASWRSDACARAPYRAPTGQPAGAPAAGPLMEGPLMAGRGALSTLQDRGGVGSRAAQMPAAALLPPPPQQQQPQPQQQQHYQQHPSEGGAYVPGHSFRQPQQQRNPSQQRQQAADAPPPRPRGRGPYAAPPELQASSRLASTSCAFRAVRPQQGGARPPPPPPVALLQRPEPWPAQRASQEPAPQRGQQAPAPAPPQPSPPPSPHRQQQRRLEQLVAELTQLRTSLRSSFAGNTAAATLGPGSAPPPDVVSLPAAEQQQLRRHAGGSAACALSSRSSSWTSRQDEQLDEQLWQLDSHQERDDGRQHQQDQERDDGRQHKQREEEEEPANPQQQQQQQQPSVVVSQLVKDLVIASPHRSTASTAGAMDAADDTAPAGSCAGSGPSHISRSALQGERQLPLSARVHLTAAAGVPPRPPPTTSDTARVVDCLSGSRGGPPSSADGPEQPALSGQTAYLSMPGSNVAASLSGCSLCMADTPRSCSSSLYGSDTPRSAGCSSRAADVGNIVHKAKARALARQRRTRAQSGTIWEQGGGSAAPPLSAHSDMSHHDSRLGLCSAGTAQGSSGDALGALLSLSAREHTCSGSMSAHSLNGDGLDAAAAAIAASELALTHGSSSAAAVLQDYRAIADLDAAIRARTSQTWQQGGMAVSKFHCGGGRGAGSCQSGPLPDTWLLDQRRTLGGSFGAPDSGCMQLLGIGEALEGGGDCIRAAKRLRAREAGHEPLERSAASDPQLSANNPFISPTPSEPSAFYTGVAGTAAASGCSRSSSRSSTDPTNPFRGGSPPAAGADDRVRRVAHRAMQRPVSRARHDRLPARDVAA